MSKIKKTPASEVLEELRSDVFDGKDVMIELAWEYLNGNIKDADGVIRINYATAAGWAGIAYPAKTNARNNELRKFFYKELSDEFTRYGYSVTKYTDFFGEAVGVKISAYSKNKD